MVLLIPDAVRKIKAQGYAQGYPIGHAEGYAESYAQSHAKGRQEARQRIRAALLEYCQRKGKESRDPIPVSEILKVIDDTARSI